jgi:sugar phosphate permease
MYILSILVAACGPLIGGLIGGKFGMSYVFLLTSILLIGSVFPLFKTTEPHREKKLRFSKIKIKLIWKDLVAYGGYGMQGSIGSIIWPLFIYSILKNYQKLGLVSTLSTLVAIVVTYIIGKKADHQERKKYVKSGSMLMGLIYLAKALANTIFHIFSLDVLTSFANSISTAPFQSEYYLHADEESRSEYITFMESTIDLFRVITFSLLLVCSFFLEIKFVLILGLILGGIGSFLMILMPPAKCELNFEGAGIKLMPRPAKRKVTV